MKIIQNYFNNKQLYLSWRTQMTVNPGTFPMNMDQMFKFAIGITNNAFLISINGRIISSFQFRDGNQKLFATATGFDVESGNGLRLEVQGVDHHVSDANCQGFERFSQ